MTREIQVHHYRWSDDLDDDVESTPDIHMQPDFFAAVNTKDGMSHVEIISDVDVPDAYQEEYVGFPNGLVIEVPAVTDDRDLAVTLWCSRALSEFHEILEFTTIDGERLAVPHPNETEMWIWLYSRFRQLADDYIARYPIG